MREQRPKGWWGSAPGAEAVAVGQLLVGLVLWQALPDPEDDYGLIGWGQFAIPALLLAVVFTPVLVAFTAFLHAALFTRPAIALARRAGRDRAAPAWVAAASAVCALFPWAMGAPYAASWAWIAGFGILPLRVALRARRLGSAPRAVVRATARTTALLASAALVGGTVLGWMVEYRPPQLKQAAYVGEWHDGDGGVVRLQGNGVATVEKVPVAADERVPSYCTGTGTWTHRRAGAVKGGRAGADLYVPGCAGWEPHWQVGGDEERPELFHLDGDPDGGAMRLLRRVGPVGGVAPTG